MTERLNPSTTSFNQRSFPQRAFRWIIVALFKLLVHIDVEGLENFPQSGPLLLVSNHLDILDAPIALIFTPRRMTTFQLADGLHG